MLWFKYSGEDSRDYGIFLRNPPAMQKAARRVEFVDVPGRDGTLTIYDGGREDVETELECYLANLDGMDAALKWLEGAGDLIISSDATRLYRATFAEREELHRIVRGMSAHEFDVPVRLGPYRYRVLESAAADDWTRTTSGETITNPGTAASRPKITIAGSGNVTLTIGTQQMDFEGLTDGIVVDSERMDCMSLDETELLNGMADMDEFPTLNIGANLVSWTGTVTSVTIRPRWRYV